MLPKDKILTRLKSNDNKLIVRALQEVRNYLKKCRLSDTGWLVEVLLSLLERTNTTVLDLGLSNLATLLLEQEARNTFRMNNGAHKLMKILTNLEDISILRRGFRAASNAAMDPKICHSLHQQGIASALGHKLKSTTDEQMQIILLRCTRICADSPQYRTWLHEEGLYERVCNLLQDTDLLDPDTLQSGEDSREVVKVLLKCAAKLTHGASLLQAGTVMPAISVLVAACKSSVRDIWEHGLMTIVNLSQHSSLRPSLGNAGSVNELVEKLNSGALSSRELSQVVTALCLYCRESVNRVKLRESGGCSALVNVLTSGPDNMRDRVINSLLQFMYDNHSLNVFMSVGLIPSLVSFVEEHLKSLKNKEVEESKLLPTKEKREEETNEKKEEDKLDESGSSSDDKPVDVKDEDRSKNPDSDPKESSVDTDQTGKPVFRINSPSYQAVQYELEQFMQLREIHSSDRSPRGAHGGMSPASQSMSPQGASPARTDYSPVSPPSLLQSPDRSPVNLSCGYSPQRSDMSPAKSDFSPPPSSRVNFSPARSDLSSTNRSEREYSPERLDYSGASSPEASPPRTPVGPGSVPVYSPILPTYSPSLDSTLSPQPADPSYSPIETFSDEEDHEEKESEKVKDKKEEENVDAPKPGSSKEPSESQPVMTTLPSLQKNLESTSISPETVLPAAKRPRLSIQQPVYKYSASSVGSPQIRKTIDLPKPSRVSESSEEKTPKSAGGRLDWILDILSRLTQADRPHEDLTSSRTMHCLFALGCKDPGSYPRVFKIISRLSKNLYCLFPFLIQRHPTWFVRRIEQEWPPECGDQGGDGHSQVVKSGFDTVYRNLTSLAETGYGEGEICHRLVNPAFSQEDKFSIAISSAQLVKERRKLANILINHDSLDMLIDLLEQTTDEELFEDTVLCLSTVSGHVGIVSPNLTLPPNTVGACTREDLLNETCNLLLELDDGSTVATNRQLLTSASSVFAAMLEGGFLEAQTSRVRIPETSNAPLECLVHYLSGCTWCHQFAGLGAEDLLELLELSDRYLLSELNITISHQIVRGCMHIDGFVLKVYEKSLQKRYPVQCSDSSLSECTISTVLVADMTSQARARLVNSLVQSNLRSDFLDDVNRMIRKKILSK